MTSSCSNTPTYLLILPWIFPEAPSVASNAAPGNTQGNIGRYASSVRQIEENSVSEIYWINGGIRLLYRQKHSVFRIGHAYPWTGLSSYEPAYLSTRPDVHAPDYRWVCRMLHGPSLVAIRLSVGYEAWPPIGWHHAFVIDWFKYRLGLPSALWAHATSGNSHRFQIPVTIPLHHPTGRQMPAVRAGRCARGLWKSLMSVCALTPVTGGAVERSVRPFRQRLCDITSAGEAAFAASFENVPFFRRQMHWYTERGNYKDDT